MAYISGTINGISVEGKCISLSRQHHICSPCQVATLTLAPSFTDTVDPGMEVVLYEDGTKCITGYVVKATKNAGEATHVVEIHDTYHRVSMTFIEGKITTGYDEFDQPIRGYDPLPTSYWIGYLCGLAGISYAIDSGSSYLVPAGVQLGLRTVHESLLDILAYSSQACYVDANGALRFLRVTRNIPSRTFTECLEINDSTGDEMTRNVIKVFGYQGVTNRIFSVDSVAVDGIVPDRVAAVGSPMIQTQTEADRVARFLVGELGVQTRIVTIKIPGDPSINLATVARINFETTDYTDAITSISSTIDQNGYIMEVTIGERCPRISGWSTELLPVYAGTSGSGVYKSTDSGDNWVEYNEGLPVGRKFVKKLAFNPLGEGMAIVNSTLYHTDGTTGWSARSLPAPVNMAGDSPAIGYGDLQGVSAKGAAGEFCVLTTNVNSSGSDVQQCRSWVYESTGSGANSWESVQLYDTDTGLTPGDSTGSGYHVYGYDISSEVGVPYIAASSGSLYSYLPGALVIKGDMNRTGVLDTAGVLSCGDFGQRGVLDYYITDMRLTGDGVFTFRKLFVDFYFVWNDPDLETMRLDYKILGNSDMSTVDLGPYAVIGTPPFTSELTYPYTPPWPVAAKFHAATLEIREVDVSPFGSPFVLAFTVRSASRINANTTWEIYSGDPRSCSEWIADTLSSPTTNAYTTCGFITYQFEPVE